MRKAGMAGAIALVVVGSSLALTTQLQARAGYRSASHIVLNEGHIAHLRATLRLTPDQEKYWPPVAAALRSVIREQRGEAAGSEHYQLASMTSRPALDSSKIQRVTSAAMPLLATLSAEQKRHAMRFARSIGLESASY
jgi:zinc resistance-associated protein